MRAVRDNNIDISKYRNFYLVVKTNKKYSHFDENMSYKEYRQKASELARARFEGVKPDNLVIDHLYSVKDGYENKVPLNIISKAKNLRIITETENQLKGANSIITLDELYR